MEGHSSEENASETRTRINHYTVTHTWSDYKNNDVTNYVQNF